MHVEQFESVEFRVGNDDKTGSPLGPFTNNQWIGFIGPPSTVQVHTLSVEPEVHGRFLTLQTMVDAYLGIDEIYAKSMI